MSKTELYLSGIIKYGLYAILLTPLAFYPRALYGFMTPKFILFQVLVEIVFGAWLILKLIDFQNVRNRASNIKFSWLTISLLIFTAISFISALLGVDFARSFWGIGARMTGLFAEMHFLAWFLVLVSTSNPNLRIHSNSTNENTKISSIRMSLVDLNRYINFSFAICIIVALTAFYQNTQWHLVPGYTIFSNPTFVAPYFLFHFFWGLYQAINLKNVRNSVSNIIFGAGGILIVTALVMGQVRGAIIGLLAGLFIIGIFLIFSDILAKKRHKIFIAALMILVILSVAAIFIFKDSEFVKNSTYLKRFSSISLSATTAQTRILTWQAALNGFYDKPILGVGPENFNYLFNTHYNPRLLMYGGSSFAETWQDKPHNAFIEILAETGIIGSLAYISIWLFVAFYLFKIFKKGDKFLSLILASAFIAYFGAIFFSFDSFGSWFGLYLMLGFLASHSSNTNDANKHTNNTNIVVNIRGVRIISILFVLAVIALLYLNYGIWRANVADADALRIFSKDTTAGIALFSKSLSYKSPYKSEYRFDLIASVAGAVEKGLPMKNLENIINTILEEADNAIVAHPDDASKYTDMARIYNIFGTLGRDSEILAQAELFGRKSLELSPNRQETLFYLARTALLESRPNIALEWAKQALSADPTICVSHWYMGLALVANGQTEEGALEIKKALDLGYRPRNDAEKIFIKNLGL